MKTNLTILFILICFFTFGQQKIKDIRNAEGQEVTVSGIVTNGSEFGIIRYFQDETGGLAAYGEQVSSLKRGDSITITGTLKNYRNLLELDPVKSVTVHSSGHSLPKPKIISAAEIGEDYEGQLIQINNAKITNANGTFSGSTNYDFSAGGGSGEMRINPGTNLVGQVIPTEEFNLVAICGQYSFNQNDTRSGYQLLPRDLNDFISVAALNFTAPVSVTNIEKNSITLTWKTDAESTPRVDYRLAYSAESWIKTTEGISAKIGDEYFHSVEITGLEPASYVLATAYSTTANDTIKTQEIPFVTESNSSGEIRIYFNTPVDESVATPDNIAKNIDNAMEDTLISYINRAKESIDFCIYNFNNGGISDVSSALNEAHSRGVKVRFITSGTTAHSGTYDLHPNIKVLESPDGNNAGIMHNKFAVFDALAENQDVPWVWTGSLNISYEQVNTDAQNILFIQDKALALVYLTEFEEMWGGTDIIPNYSKSKFGAEKTDNTPHELRIGGNRVECYFSPSDNANQKIIDAINTADNDLNVETMVITRTDIALAIKNAYNRGTEVHVLTNYVNDNSETVNNILNELPAGKFIFDDVSNGILHHKLAIIDANFAASDPQVITGSHNWSNSANDRNDENTLIIHNADIANQYFQQFAQRFKENTGNLHVSANVSDNLNLQVFPNPATNGIFIRSSSIITQVELFDVSGMLVKTLPNVHSTFCEINLEKMNPGMYFLKIKFENNRFQNFKILKN